MVRRRLVRKSLGESRVPLPLEVQLTRQFKAVTGNAFTLLYQVDLRTYGWPLTLPWARARKVNYTDREFEVYHKFEIDSHSYLTEPSKIPLGALIKHALWWRFFFGVGLSATFLFTAPILRSRRLRMVWIAAGVVALMAVTEQSGYPHYISPAAPAILLFALMGVRYLACSPWAMGRALVRVAIPVWVVLLGVRAVALSPRTPPSATANYFSWCCTDARLRDREPLLEKIAALPGKHLVIVTYDLSSYDTFDGVYNNPDIDSSKVVFARDMGPEKERALLAYYPDRRVWHIVIGPKLPSQPAPVVTLKLGYP